MLLLLLTLLLSAATSVRAEARPLTTMEKQQLLDTHNTMRQMVANGRVQGQPPAADMKVLQWDERLAAKAENWVNQCHGGHDSYDDRRIHGFYYVGQNWAGGYKANFSFYVELWFDEHREYDFSSKYCSRTCGHYTQIVWADTQLVGCAVAKCSHYPYHLVCDYATAGNFNGRSPYLPAGAAEDAATACSGEFSWRQGGLCVAKEMCSVAKPCECGLSSHRCLGGGQLDEDMCKCVCPENRFGTFCEKKCEDRPGYSLACQQNGIKDCAAYGAYCTKSCKLCKDEVESLTVQPAAGVVAKVAINN